MTGLAIGGAAWLALVVLILAWFRAGARRNADFDAAAAVAFPQPEPLPPTWVNDGAKLHIVWYGEDDCGWAMRCTCGYRVGCLTDRAAAVNAGALHHGLPPVRQAVAQ